MSYKIIENHRENSTKKKNSEREREREREREKERGRERERLRLRKISSLLKELQNTKLTYNKDTSSYL